MRIRFIPLLALAFLLISDAYASLETRVITGDAILKTGGGHHLYVYIESEQARTNRLRPVRENDPREPAGAEIDHVFWLASTEPFAGPLVLDLRHATAVVTPNRVVISSPTDHTVVVLALADAADPADEHFPSGFNVLRFRGYGISHKIGGIQTTLAQVRKLVPRSDFCDATVSGDACNNLEQLH